MPSVRKESNTAVSDAEDWVSLPTAARLLGCHRQKTLQLALKGELESDVRGDWTFISRASIDRYLAAHPSARAD